MASHLQLIRLMKGLTRTTFIIFFFSLAASSFANDWIKCQSTLKGILVLSNEKEAFLVENFYFNQRSPSSAGAEEQVSRIAKWNQKTALTKVFYRQRKRIRVGLERNQDRDISGRISISVPGGHEMNYPLECSHVPNSQI